MCQWLSCSEWCDVYLQCSGRVFRAHRAVLASVSNFLREALLSCPAGETPVLIILPEFDHDSVSSMLYYIYNGEVVIKKSHMEKFLEIINAMQIFIDSEYLTNITDLIKTHDVNTHCQYLDLQTSARLVRGDNDNNEYINLSTSVNLQKVFKPSQNSFQYKHVNKDIEQNKRWLNESFSDYLKSVHEYRQRQSFSRGLFIETSSLNGNSNGNTDNVLAITNECYRKPTSLHLTNANSGYLDTNNLLTKRSIMEVSENISKLKFKQQDIKKYGMFCGKNWYEISGFHDYNKTQIGLNVLCKRTFNGIKEDEGEDWFFTRKPVKVQEIEGGNFDVNYPNFLSNEKSSPKNEEKRIQEPSHSRAAIHNKVMQSPWRSKVPNNYKPSHNTIQNISTDYVCKTYMASEDYRNNNAASTVKSTSKISVETENEDGDSCEYMKCSKFADNELKSHVKQCARYRCVECHKSFSQLRNYKYHMSIHRGTKEFAATCPVCGKYFNDKGYLSSHMKIHRNRKEYKCSICPKSFNQRVAYNMHMRIHTGVKPHVCEECGKAFSRKMLLKQHFRTHSGERPYACSHCDKRFADRSNMTLHLRLHTGIKPFKCSLCPKSFTKKHHLKSHLNFHTGDKPYSCPRCKLAFTQSSNMRTHYKKCNIILQVQL